MFQQYLKREGLRFEIHQNVIPQSYKPIEGCKYYDELEDKVVIFPRLGTFEVKVMGMTVFSKMLEGCWPKQEKVLFVVEEIVNELRKRDKQKQRQKNTKGRELSQDQEDAIFWYDLYKRFDIKWRLIQKEQETTTKMFRVREIARKRNIQFSELIEYKTGISLQKGMLATANFQNLKRPQKLPQVRLKNRSHCRNLTGFSTINSIDRRTHRSIIEGRIEHNPETQVIYPIRKPSVIFPSPKVKSKLSELRRKLKVYQEDHPTRNSKDIDSYLQPVFPQYFKRSDPRYLLEREEIKERMIIVEKLEEGLAMNERKKKEEQEDTNQDYSPDRYENRGNYARQIIQNQYQNQQRENKPKRRQLVIPKQRGKKEQVQKDPPRQNFKNNHEEKRQTYTQSLEIRKQLINQNEVGRLQEIAAQNNESKLKNNSENLCIKQQGHEKKDAQKEIKHRKERQYTLKKQQGQTQERIQNQRERANNEKPANLINDNHNKNLTSSNHQESKKSINQIIEQEDSKDNQSYSQIPHLKGEQSIQSLDFQLNTSELKYSNSVYINRHAKEELIKVLDNQDSSLSVRLKEPQQAFLKHSQPEKVSQEQSSQRKKVVSDSNQEKEHQKLSFQESFHNNAQKTLQEISQEQLKTQRFKTESQQKIQSQQNQILMKGEQSKAREKIQEQIQRKISWSQADQQFRITDTLIQNANCTQSSIIIEPKFQRGVGSLQKIHWKASFRFTEQQNMLDQGNSQETKGQYLLMKQNETYPPNQEQEEVKETTPHSANVLTDNQKGNSSDKIQSNNEEISLKRQEEQKHEKNTYQKVIWKAVYNNKRYNLERQEKLHKD